MRGLLKRRSGNYWIHYMAYGKQRFENAHTKSKRLALKLLSVRKAEVVEGRFQFVSTRPPTLEEWSNQFLESIQHTPTKLVYTSLVKTLKEFFGANTRLSHMTVGRIEEFKQKRLSEKAGPAIINRALSCLRRMLNLAARRRLIGRNPFAEVEFLNERQSRRQPHILTFDEQEKLLAVAPPGIRIEVVLLTETGLRPHKEARQLKWEDVDLVNDVIRVRRSKTAAGVRAVPVSGYLKAELLRWKDLVGSFSEYVFPSFRSTRHPLRGGRKSWVSTLEKAGLDYFRRYDLRATYASRLSAAGVPDVFVAQMLGHSTTSVLPTYSRAIEEFRREAIRKLEAHRLGLANRTSADTVRRDGKSSRPVQ